MLAFLILAGVGACCGALAYRLALGPYTADIEHEKALAWARAQRKEQEQSKPVREGAMSRAAAFVEQVLPITRESERAYRERLDRAGVRMSASKWRGICVIVTLIGAFLGFTIGGTFASLPGNAIGALIGAFIGWIGCKSHLSRATKARGKEIERILPDALERLASVIASGISLDEAFREVARDKGMGPVGEEFARVDREINLINITREEALSAMSRRCSNIDMTFFVSALIQSLREGASIASTVQQQSKSARAAWFSRMREQINKVDTKISTTLGLCFLPATVLLTCAPIILQQVEGLGKIFG